MSMDLVFDERPPESPLIERIWYSRSTAAGSFVSIAGSQSEMVITRLRGQAFITLRGPETKPTEAFCPPDAEFMGIQFKPGTFMPDFPASALIDRNDINLPDAGTNRFWLKGGAWEFPTLETANVFVNRLVRDELLVYDPLVESVLRQHPVDTSLRTAQRRFLRATGLTYNTLFQIERARQAAILLRDGNSILDTVAAMDYFDQPHLTRSLRQFIGFTPTQIQNPARQQPLSFLYKTLSSDWLMLSSYTAPTGENLYEEDRPHRVHVAGRRDRSAGDLALPLHYR
jgi:AraC-like DNA-binding protein